MNIEERIAKALQAAYESIQWEKLEYEVGRWLTDAVLAELDLDRRNELLLRALHVLQALGVDLDDVPGFLSIKGLADDVTAYGREMEAYS